MWQRTNFSDSMFDRFAIIDWSGGNTAKRGKDSIWIAASRQDSVNPPTRQAATDALTALIQEALSDQQRLLIGFDFAFGSPSGFAAALGHDGWQDVWAHLHESIIDRPDNRNNRFEVAAGVNRKLTHEGPFWGYTMKADPPKGLSRKKPQHWSHPFAYSRHAERLDPRAKSVFQLAYNGAVGSQSLLGIARLEGLRRRFPGQIAIWPFETNFDQNLSAPVIFAEIYPSRHHVPNGPEVLDQRQVEAVLRDFEDWNGPQLLHALSAPGLNEKARTKVRAEEGWIVGLSPDV